ncbi:hypothetical protein ACWEOW_01190 [Monashia sp. NPDC004114]
MDGASERTDALDWAAAQASVQGAALSIVHAFHVPSIFDPFVPVGVVDGHTIDAASTVVREAAARVHDIAPEVAVSTQIVPGSLASAVLQNVPPSALVVLGHPGSGSDGRTLAKLLRHSRGRVVVVQLVGDGHRGPSAGRVVVVYDGARASETAMDAAFGEARQRSVDLTALLLSAEARYRLAQWQRRYPDVVVHPIAVTGPLEGELATASEAAALVVLPQRRRRRGPFRRRLRPWAQAFVRSATSPVLLVPDRHQQPIRADGPDSPDPLTR